MSNDSNDIDISADEFFAISRHLESYHSVFYQIWELGHPVFTREHKTAAVGFDKNGRVLQFLFNPDFWRNNSDTKKAFVIAHECLHVLLKHGLRTKNSINEMATNYALDIVVNHMLISQFGFDREEIDPENKYCWIDNVFFGRSDILPNQTVEYYFNRLPEEVSATLVDCHDTMDGSETEYVSGKISDEDRSSLKNIGGEFIFVSNKPVVKKRRWETIIHDWVNKHSRPNEFDAFEQWARINRRFIAIPDDALLPTEMELQEKSENRILVYFFLDTSGSCRMASQRFWQAAKSVPEDRFECMFFCFDTRVYPISEREIAKGKLKGGGGTNFGIIENFIQAGVKKNGKYPEAVFVATDGAGTRVNPEKPELWHWFLTDRAVTSYIPKKCNIYKLKDFE